MKNQKYQDQSMRLLTDAFRSSDIIVDEIQTFKPDKPVNLAKILRTLFVDESEYDELEYAGELEDFLGISISALLGFEYLSLGPMAFYHSLSVFRFDNEFSFVGFTADEQDTQLFFQYPTKHHDVVIPHFLRAFFISNGTRYGFDGLFRNLPSTMHVSDKVISIEVLRQLYRLFLDSESVRDPDRSPWIDELEANERLLGPLRKQGWVTPISHEKIRGRFVTPVDVSALQDPEYFKMAVEQTEAEKNRILEGLLILRTNFLYDDE